MKRTDVSPLTASSAALLLCGFADAVFNILRKFFHLIDTVRSAAELQTDYKDIAISVYDLFVIFNLSSGILAAIQIIAGILGLIYAAAASFGKNPVKSPGTPQFFGTVCVIIGVVSVISLFITKSAGAFLSFTLVITQLIVPIIFTVYAKKFKISIKSGGETQ